jgi:glycosyltransferase involved in cell wall biosynthesis
MMISFVKNRISLTIVTVCLNSEKTIARTIESVKQQKSRDVEYIVIDGDSHDGTRDIIRSYGDVIDDFVSEPDKGISDAFNKGIAKSAGEVIGLLNADDQLLPGTIEKVLRCFRDNPETEILHGDVLLYERAQLVKRLRPPRFWWFPWRLVLFNHPATFVRRSVYDHWGGYRTDYAIAMDVERFAFWKKKGCRISYLPEPLVRMVSGGMSGRSGYRGVSEKRKALLDHGYNRLMVELQYATGLLIQWYLSTQTPAIRLPLGL